MATARASKVNFETLDIAAARNRPNTQREQFNTAEDETQLVFRSYLSPGNVHCILLRRPEFYSRQVNGTRPSNWVAGLAVGRAVDNIPPTNGK